MAFQGERTLTRTVEVEGQVAHFFYNIIPNMYNVKGSTFFKKCKIASNAIRHSKYTMPDMQQKETLKSDMIFKEPEERCAYLQMYGEIHTCMVHEHFMHYLTINPDILNMLLSKQSINICCLGGGPCTEAIAISKIINDLVQSSIPKEYTTKRGKGIPFFTVPVNVTIADICSDWEKDMLSLMNAVNNSSEILSSGRVKIRSNFIQADLLDSVNRDLKDKIREADIVTMVKLGSDIGKKNPENLSKLSETVFRVAKLLKEDACFFILDCSGGSTFSQLRDSIYSVTESTNVDSLLHRQYTLNSEIIDMLKAIFARARSSRCIAPTMMAKVSSCAWIKKEKQSRGLRKRIIIRIYSLNPSKETTEIATELFDLKIIPAPPRIVRLHRKSKRSKNAKPKTDIVKSTNSLRSK